MRSSTSSASRAGISCAPSRSTTPASRGCAPTASAGPVSSTGWARSCRSRNRRSARTPRCRVPPDTAVLRVDGSPIPGLHAAGEVVGGFHGAS
ncbi:MAG: FAD-binding protein, partial [Microbacterium sp.]